MPAKDYTVWVWLDEERLLAFCFYGRHGTPERLFRMRFDVDSELNDWLLTLTTQPKLHPDRSFSTVWPSYGNQCRQLLRQIQKSLKKDGFTLLSSRDKRTINAGHKPKRPVFVEVNGKRQFFFSISAAARATGRDKSSISLAAADPRRLDVTYA